MFDQWLRFVWNSFLWWLPGSDDDGETSHGKGEPESKQGQPSQQGQQGQQSKQGQSAGSGAASTDPGAAKSGGAASGGKQTAAGGSQAKTGAANAAEGGAKAESPGGTRGRAKGQGKAKAAGSAAGGDDLTAIKGIGPTLSQRLQGLGIRSYADLVKADPEDLAARVNQRTVTAKKVRDWIADAKSRMG